MDDQPSVHGGSATASGMKDRLRHDLAMAMRAREKARARVIRDLIAAFDNAEAVPVGDRHERYVVHAFGDRAAEVPRLMLSKADLAMILAREIAVRKEAAAQLISLNRPASAKDLFAEVEVIESYASPV